MTEDQKYVKDHPEMLGFKMELARWLKMAERAGDKDMARKLKKAIAICNNPPANCAA